MRSASVAAGCAQSVAGGVSSEPQKTPLAMKLEERIGRDGPLPVADAVDCILQAARGLAFAHGKGVVHRDIKPANLLLDSEGVVKILDMGLARIDDGNTADHQLTNTGTVMGTVDYMPPEQARGKLLDERADVYAIGAILYHVLSGVRPYAEHRMVDAILDALERVALPVTFTYQEKDGTQFRLDQAYLSPEIEVEKGFAGVMETFDATRPIVAAMAVGVARAALEELRKILTDAGIEISYDKPAHAQSAAAAEFLRMAQQYPNFHYLTAISRERNVRSPILKVSSMLLPSADPTRRPRVRYDLTLRRRNGPLPRRRQQ